MRQGSRLRWRTDAVSIGKHKVSCITFDDLHSALQRAESHGVNGTTVTLQQEGTRPDGTSRMRTIPSLPAQASCRAFGKVFRRRRRVYRIPG
jgi:hypothetical protein